MTTANFRNFVFLDGAFRLNDVLMWVYGVERSVSVWSWVVRGRKYKHHIKQLLEHLPLGTLDTKFGPELSYFRDWFANYESDDSYWQLVNYRPKLSQVTARSLLIAGWYDVFLRDQLEDYAVLKSAGRQPYLTITPFTHTLLFSQSNFVRNRDPFVIMRESLAWLELCLKNQDSQFRQKPVRYYELISDQWIEANEWPPPNEAYLLYLHPDGDLYRDPAPPNVRPSQYTYAPSAPTPSLGGALGDIKSGPTDNRPLITRNDVLCYTSKPLTQGLSIAGAVSLLLYVKSNLEYTDFFGRLCVAYPNGLSVNLCDGLFRLEPDNGERQPDGTVKIEVDMWSTAARFKVGQRIQLLVASGAFPRWSRNLGYGDPLGTGERMQVAEQTVYHDRDHPSALILPLVCH